jgi:hypothetical protein
MSDRGEGCSENDPTHTGSLKGFMSTKDPAELEYEVTNRWNSKLRSPLAHQGTELFQSPAY